MKAKEKVCAKCLRLKAVERFYRRGNGHHSYCKDCCRAVSRLIRAGKKGGPL